MKIRPRTLRTVLPPLLLTTFAVAHAEERVSQTLPAPIGTVVEVHNVVGTIDIRSHDAAQVDLVARLEGPRDDLTLEAVEGRILIRVRPDKGDQGRRESTRAHLDIKVPRTAALTVKAVSADVTVKGTSGPLEIGAVSGDVDVQSAARAIELATVSGNIRFRGDAPRIRGETVSGRIVVYAESAAADLTAVSGDIQLKAGTLEQLDLRTISGDIEVHGRFDARGDFDLETKAGDIHIVQPANAPARFSFRTFSGDFEASLPVSKTGRREVEAGRGDGPRVSIKTFAGDVKVSEE